MPATMNQSKARFYIGSDAKDAAGEWLTVCRQRQSRGRDVMQQGQDAADGAEVGM